MIAVSRRASWVMILTAGLGAAIGMWNAGLTLEFRSCDVRILALAIVLPISLLHRRIVGDRARRLAEIIEMIALFSAISLLCALASYVIAAGTHGFADDKLAMIDRALGFDWVNLYRFVASHPVLAPVERTAYLSIFITPIGVLGALCWTGRAKRARQFIAAFAIALAITLILFVFLPAQSALVHHIGTHPDYLPATGLDHVEIIHRLRTKTMTAIDPGDLAGLITFPSVHTISALMFVWAGWPMRRMRPVLLVTNGAMLLSIPIGGTHYLIDMIGAAVVTVASIGLLYMSPNLTKSVFRSGLPSLQEFAAN